MQGDFGHSALASFETNETIQPAQDTSEVPVPSVTESDTVKGVAGGVAIQSKHKKRNCFKRAYIHNEQDSLLHAFQIICQVLQCTVGKSASINHQVKWRNQVDIFGQILIQTTCILSAKTFNKATWTICTMRELAIQLWSTSLWRTTTPSYQLQS